MKLILLSLLSTLAFAEQPVNKSQLCEMYYGSFIISLDLYEETKSCLDLEYGILSFKQLLLTKCDNIDQDDIDVARAYDSINTCKN